MRQDHAAVARLGGQKDEVDIAAPASVELSVAAQYGGQCLVPGFAGFEPEQALDQLGWVDGAGLERVGGGYGAAELAQAGRERGEHTTSPVAARHQRDCAAQIAGDGLLGSGARLVLRGQTELQKVRRRDRVVVQSVQCHDGDRRRTQAGDRRHGLALQWPNDHGRAVRQCLLIGNQRLIRRRAGVVVAQIDASRARRCHRAGQHGFTRPGQRAGQRHQQRDAAAATARTADRRRRRQRRSRSRRHRRRDSRG